MTRTPRMIQPVDIEKLLMEGMQQVARPLDEKTPVRQAATNWGARVGRKAGISSSGPGEQRVRPARTAGPGAAVFSRSHDAGTTRRYSNAGSSGGRLEGAHRRSPKATGCAATTVIEAFPSTPSPGASAGHGRSRPWRGADFCATRPSGVQSFAATSTLPTDGLRQHARGPLRHGARVSAT